MTQNREVIFYGSYANNQYCFNCGDYRGKIAERLTLPKVSGYLVAGVLIGPSIFKIFESYSEVVKYDIISELALSIIAFSIGSEFIYREIKN